MRGGPALPAPLPLRSLKGRRASRLLHRVRQPPLAPDLVHRPHDRERLVERHRGALGEPCAQAARHLGAYAKELAKAVRGKSEAAPDPKDKRFADPAWASSPVHKRLLQAHLATGKELERYIDSTSLNARDKARAHLVASIFVDAIAPSNTLLNPTALKRAVEAALK